MDTLIKIFLDAIRKLKMHTDAWSVNHTISNMHTLIQHIDNVCDWHNRMHCIKGIAKEANTLLNSITEQIYVNL